MWPRQPGSTFHQGQPFHQHNSIYCSPCHAEKHVVTYPFMVGGLRGSPAPSGPKTTIVNVPLRIHATGQLLKNFETATCWDEACDYPVQLIGSLWEIGSDRPAYVSTTIGEMLQI